MVDWYRRKTWTKEDEEEFFTKLGRARKYGRAQYLQIQAIELIETKDKQLLDIAESLLIKLLTDYPDNRIERSQAFNSLGEIFKMREDFDKALEYFKKALDFEKEFPNVITTAYLNFAETVVQSAKTEFYDEVEKLLTEKIRKDTLTFPVQNYIMYSVLSVIADFKGDFDNAKKYSVIAEKNATAKTNTLWNPKKKSLGTVNERRGWLDKLLNRG